MDYAQQQRNPTRHAFGLLVVIVAHILVIYALVTGLARKAVEVIKKPLETQIIEEIKPPPPPPPPPKKIEIPKPPPPETYVPPPDIPVMTAPTGPTITVVTPEPPKAPPVIEAPKPPPPPPPPKPAVRRGIQRIGGENPEFPKAAIRAGIEKGHVVARLNIDENGNVTDVTIVSADPPRHFDKEVIYALKTWKFRPEGEKYVGEVEINFSLKD